MNMAQPALPFAGAKVPGGIRNKEQKIRNKEGNTNTVDSQESLVVSQQPKTGDKE
jgi:hypothetical protein